MKSITFIHIIEKQVRKIRNKLYHVCDVLLICARQTAVAPRVKLQLRFETFTLAFLCSTAVAFGKTLATRG
jgi:hypothetical protein